MFKFIDKWVYGWSFKSDPGLGDYMFSGFMLLCISFMVILIPVSVIVLVEMTAPWSIPVLVLLIAFFGLFWYAWRRNETVRD